MLEETSAIVSVFEFEIVVDTSGALLEPCFLLAWVFFSSLVFNKYFLFCDFFWFGFGFGFGFFFAQK